MGVVVGAAVVCGAPVVGGLGAGEGLGPGPERAEQEVPVATGQLLKQSGNVAWSVCDEALQTQRTGVRRKAEGRGRERERGREIDKQSE